MSTTTYHSLFDIAIRKAIAREDLRDMQIKVYDTITQMNHNRYGAITKQLVQAQGDKKAKLSLNQQGAVSGFTLTLWFSYPFRKAFYQEIYNALADSFTSGVVDSWKDAISLIEEGVMESSAAYVRMIEEKEGVRITSVEQFQQITGIDAIEGVWNQEKGEVVPYKGHTIEDPKQEAIEQLTDVLNEAWLYNYTSAVEEQLRAGASYNQVVAIDAAAYGLPDGVINVEGVEYTREKALARAVAQAFDLMANESGADLRSIAEAIGAPYPLLLEASDIAAELLEPYRTL